jgi:hypothetical protein
MDDDCANVDVQIVSTSKITSFHSRCGTKLQLGYKHWARQYSGNTLTDRQVNAKAAGQYQHGSD